MNGLTISAVHLSFAGRVVLAGVDLDVPHGRAFALVGSNGAGKSTLMNVCLGYLRPEHGSVWIAGTSIDSDPIACKRNLAYVPEVARLYSHYSAIDNLVFFEGLMKRRRSVAECAGLLCDLGIDEAAVRRPLSTYSKGMRQKVSIALGLLKGASVFLLDEPMTGLDPSATDDFRITIRRLCGEAKAVLFTTHDLDRLDEVADRAGVLEAGRIRPYDFTPRYTH